jgi:FkbM family methyltransferase
MDINNQGFEKFIKDIEPFFYERHLTYVDVGAFTGDMFLKLMDSALTIKEAHLLEPNPSSITLLREKIARSSAHEIANVYPLAVGANPGKLILRPAVSMTKVISAEGSFDDSSSQLDSANLIEARCITLDVLTENITERHISLLKIDVEGYEEQVLSGGSKLLSEQLVDIVYIEAGINPSGKQQCFYQTIDNMMQKHGYRMFRIYEQTSEWVTDSPFLRRIDIAYMSPRFANANPYKLTQKLFAESKKNIALEEDILQLKQIMQEERDLSTTHESEQTQRIASLEAILEGKEQSLREREQHLLAAHAAHKEAKDQIKASTDVIASLKQTIFNEHNHTVKQQSEQTQRLTELSASLQEKDRMLQVSEQNLLAAHAAHKEAREELKASNEMLSSVKQSIKDEREQALLLQTEQMQRIANLEFALHAKEQTLLETKQDLFTAHAAHKESREQLKTTTDELSSLKQDAHNERKEAALLQSEQAQRIASVEFSLQENEKSLQEHQKQLLVAHVAHKEAKTQIKSLAGEMSSLKQQLLHERQRAAKTQVEQNQLITTLKNTLQRREESLQKREQHLTKARAARIEAEEQLKTANDELSFVKQLLEAHKLALSSSENLLSKMENNFRESIRLTNTYRKNTLKAQNEAALGQLAADRVKKHLSYRLGAAMLQYGRSPLTWYKLPSALIRAHKEFLYDKKNPVPTYMGEIPVDRLSISKPTTQIPLFNEWQTVQIRASSDERELWVSAVSADETGGGFTLELSMPQAPELQMLCQAQQISEANGQSNEVMHEIRMFPDQSIRMLLAKNHQQNLDLKLRRQRGAPCILKLEIRTAKPHKNSGNGKTRSSSPTDLAQLPIQNNEQENSNAHSAEGVESSLTPSDNVISQRGVQTATIFDAHQLMESGKTTEGISLALTYARGTMVPAVNLLQANLALSNDAAWLKFVNAYVAQYNISPIELMPSGPSRFLRITSNTKARVEAGPLVSIIMPAFNAENTLEFAAKSVLSQTWRPLELIIVDDMSTDSTPSIAKQLAKQDSRVKVMHNRVNVGPYVSKNLGLSMAKGAYITGHDADDWAHPERIQRHIEYMLKQNGKVLASLTKMIRLQESGLFNHFAKIGKVSDDGANRVASISCMFQAEALRSKLGFWDSVRFGADSEMIARAQKVFGSGFTEIRQLGMFCLDTEGSLTNHPEHGVSKTEGISPSRRYYREQWVEWHQDFGSGDAYLPFPQTKRSFDAPEVAIVPESSLNILCNDLMRKVG